MGWTPPSPRADGGAEMNVTTYGLDIAKRVFQLYWVDVGSGEVHNRKFGKQEMI